MSSQLRGCGLGKRPTSQARLSFTRTTPLPRTNDESEPESLPPTRPASPVSSALSMLGSSQFNDFIPDSNTEGSQESTSKGSTTKTKRKRTAWVYRHMEGIDDMQTVFFNSEGIEVWPCRYCAKSGKHKEYLVSAGTTNIEKYLNKQHSVYENSPMEKRLQEQQQSIHDAMLSAEFNTSKKRKLTEVILDEKVLDGATIEALFVLWIAGDDQALQVVECPEFRTFLTYLNSNINVYLTNTHSTCGDWVIRQYGIEKERFQSRLHSSRTKIHISCDI